ncbi:MAG: hypothetical protein WCK31_03785 [bacterium]
MTQAGTPNINGIKPNDSVVPYVLCTIANPNTTNPAEIAVAEAVRNYKLYLTGIQK